MKIISLRAKLASLIENRNYNKEKKLLNKYVYIDENVPYDAAVQLHQARKVIANYAKANGITVRIADAEKKASKDIFEYDIDEKMTERMSKGNLSITVKPIKLYGNNKLLQLASVEDFVSKDVNKIHVYKSCDSFISANKLVKSRLEHEDNFLRNIYRKIETAVKEFEENKI